MSTQKTPRLDVVVCVLVTLIQTVAFVMSPDAPGYAGYIYGSFHGVLWFWALTRRIA